MVQRYNPDYIMHAARFAPFARENEHGDFVKFSDYEALKAERDALAQRVEMLAQNLGNAIWGEQEALQRVNALAVENENQRDWINKCSELWDAGCDLDNLLGLIPETPATDAALAAIEAQGVEKFAERMLTLANDPTYSTTSHRNDLRDAGAKAMNYAAELREAK